MTNRIDILSPGPGCHKTQRLAQFLKNFVRKHHVKAEIHIITDRRALLTYRTWILPSVFVNGEPDDRITTFAGAEKRRVDTRNRFRHPGFLLPGDRKNPGVKNPYA